MSPIMAAYARKNIAPSEGAEFTLQHNISVGRLRCLFDIAQTVLRKNLGKSQSA
jgi:hypothetical protein